MRRDRTFFYCQPTSFAAAPCEQAQAPARPQPLLLAYTKRVARMMSMRTVCQFEPGRFTRQHEPDPKQTFVERITPARLRSEAEQLGAQPDPCARQQNFCGGTFQHSLSPSTMPAHEEAWAVEISLVLRIQGRNKPTRAKAESKDVTQTTGNCRTIMRTNRSISNIVFSMNQTNTKVSTNQIRHTSG